MAALILLTVATAHAQVLSINDVSQLETNGGTTTFAFTVTLDAPAGPGGVTFDIGTANGSAKQPLRLRGGLTDRRDHPVGQHPLHLQRHRQR